jgi:hypothetical protein
MHKDLTKYANENEGKIIDAEFRKNEKFTVSQAVELLDKLRNIKLTATKPAFKVEAAINADLEFDNRPIFFDPAPDAKLPNTAIIVSTSYPFGWHRCLRVMWLDFSKGGQVRLVAVTSGFGGFWNKPKTSTNASGFGYWREFEGHIHWDAFDPARKCYDKGIETFDAFIDAYGATLRQSEQDNMPRLREHVAKYLEAKAKTATN